MLQTAIMHTYTLNLIELVHIRGLDLEHCIKYKIQCKGKQTKRKCMHTICTLDLNGYLQHESLHVDLYFKFVFYGILLQFRMKVYRSSILPSFIWTRVVIKFISDYSSSWKNCEYSIGVFNSSIPLSRAYSRGEISGT